MSFYCGSIHQGLVPEHFSDESRGIRDVYVSINKILLHRDNLSLCMQQKYLMRRAKILLLGEQTTANSSLLVSGEKRGKVRSKSALRLKRLRYRMRLIKELFYFSTYFFKIKTPIIYAHRLVSMTYFPTEPSIFHNSMMYSMI